jgi:hypothetical protein
VSIPSVKSLKELTRDSSKAVDLRRALERVEGPGTVDDALDLADRTINGHGVEAIRSPEEYVDAYYYDIVALYVNTGDTYNLTLLYDTDRNKFYVTTWGDWVEAQERAGRYSFR